MPKTRITIKRVYIIECECGWSLNMNISKRRDADEAARVHIQEEHP